ncbi:TIGR02270 family protein [Myxococcus sp. CA039A]|uniref:TIGR02270 family protein n=1 Tax=Myxococcus sp. CA039A TaxID=2741737 RepID=UPI00157AC726|nr:TIGR02270 family protein [Myxococcus sp. CA039A]NTX55206.1 TIGR02270 family protein [Myxococcus sp. CA039A]
MLLVDVLEEHLDEADFRWLQWENSLGAPDFTLIETARLEELLLAHLDGLVIGAATSADSVLRPALDAEDPFRVSAAAYSLLALGEVDEILRRLRGAEPEARTAIRRALELSEAPGLGARLLDLLTREDAAPRAEVLEMLSFRREAPPEVLAHYFAHDEQRVRVAALRAAMPLPEDAARKLLPMLLDSSHPGIRAAAMGAGLTIGVRQAWEACRAAVRAHDEHSPEAMVLFAMGGNESDVPLLLALLDAEDLRPHVLWALGFSGRVSAMEVCLSYLEVPDMARLAGESFSAMTGLRLEGPYALPAGERPEGAAPLAEFQEDLDADLEPKPEDDPPWPNVAAIKGWWRDEKRRFVKGTRYLHGQPFSGTALVEALETSPMRRRHALARELALRSRGTLMVRTRAFTHVQRAEMAKARAASSRIRMQSFDSGLR